MRKRSVSTSPVAIEFTVIPSGATSRESVFSAATTVRMPSRTKPFVWANYLPSNTGLFYLGKELGIATIGQRVRFALSVPSTYCLISERGKLAGVFDGKPYAGSPPVELAAGPHEFQVGAGEGRLAIVWAPALERGFEPFKATSERNRRLGAAD